MPLDIPIIIDTIDSEQTLPPSKTARIDFASGRIYGYIDGLEAMEQLVQKTMLTPRFKCLIYDAQIGAETDLLRQRHMDDALFETEAKRIVREALLANEDLTNVYDFEFEQSGDSRIVRFSVDTIYGPLHGQEVYIGV